MPNNTLPSQPEIAEKDARKRKKKRARRQVRAAWISFIGRIVAQFVGSAASIVLALVVVGRPHPVADPTASAAARPAGIPVPAATTGQPGPFVIVLALDQVPRGTRADDLAALLDAAVARSLVGGTSSKPRESSPDNRLYARDRAAIEAVVARARDATPEAQK